jgi:hypothetical protein
MCRGRVPTLTSRLPGAEPFAARTGSNLVGVALATSLLGKRPTVVAAVAFGVVFGLVLEVVIVNLVINRVQDVNTLYTSTPEWSWWVAHGLFGATMGLVGSTLLRRQPA